MLLRFLASTLCLFAMANAAFSQTANTSPIYELRSYVVEPGRQADTLKLISEHGIPFMSKHGIELVGVWTPLDAKDERVFTMVLHKDKATGSAAWATFQNDTGWKEAIQKSIVDGKKPVKSFEPTFLSVNDYSPSLDVKQLGNRVFELRTYVATKGNLAALNNRFKEHTLKLFGKYGMTNVVYYSVLAGETQTAAKMLEALSPIGDATAEIDSNLPATGNSLVYFLAHQTRDGAKDSFKKFGADEDWKKALKGSEAAAGGPLTVSKGVKSLFLTPAAFSPIK